MHRKRALRVPAQLRSVGARSPGYGRPAAGHRRRAKPARHSDTGPTRSVAACAGLSGFGTAAGGLPSAEAVKQQDPAAWPSWTLRAPGSEGKKCWYASTRAAAHDHLKLPAHEPAVVISEPREPEPEVTGSATEFEQARTSAPNLNSTFEDRFLAVCPIAEHTVPGCVSQPQIIGRRSDRSKFFYSGSARNSP
jgi:hypothetical protein